MDGFNFIIWMMMLNETLFGAAIELHNNNDFIASQAMLRTVKTSDQAKLKFYMACNANFLNNKKEALRYIDELEFLPVVPHRYAVVAGLMREELKQWTNTPTDLADIAREMRVVQDRLKSGDGGKKVQGTQKEIVARLTKMIDELEKPPPPKDGSQDKDVQTQAKRIPEPMKDSEIADENGKGDVNAIKIRRLAQSWGQLPPAQRAQALQDITKGMPARYRESVENYFRNLAGVNNNRR